MTSGDGPPLVVLYEDRPEHLVGLQLAILSLRDQAPSMPVAVTVPGAPPAFTAWVRDQSGVVLHDPELSLTGWNVKPSLLLHHLRAGARSVCWMDADVIVCGDLAGRLAAEPAGSLVSTEDVWWGRAQGRPDRTLLWGLEPGRIPPVTVNTALVKVGVEHVQLLERWDDLLRSDAYTSALSRPFAERPWWLRGDQEALTALLGAQECLDVDLRLLRRGEDIAQCYDPSTPSPAERLRQLRSGRQPLLVHAMGRKPWEAGTPLSLVEEAHRQLSPYTAAARSYVPRLAGEEVGWSRLTGWPSTFQRALPGHPAWAELPLSIVLAAWWQLRRVSGRLARARR